MAQLLLEIANCTLLRSRSSCYRSTK